MVTKACFVGDNFTRKPPKYERFIRPTGLRYNKAHVTHPELKATVRFNKRTAKKINSLKFIYQVLSTDNSC
jgi:ribosomal protein S8E